MNPQQTDVKRPAALPFRTEAWYKVGATVFSTAHGSLYVNEDEVRFVVDDGKLAFALPFTVIQKVRLDPSEFYFKTADRGYLVSLFNLKKYSGEIAAGAIGGVRSSLNGVRTINDANKDSIILENSIKTRGIPTYGLKTNVDYAARQRKSAILLFVYLFVIVITIGAIVSLSQKG